MAGAGRIGRGWFGGGGGGWRVTMNATLITKNCKGKEAVIKVNGVPGQEASHLLGGGRRKVVRHPLRSPPFCGTQI